MVRPFLLLIPATLFGCTQTDRAPRSIDQLQRAAIHTFRESELDAYLCWYAAQPGSLTQRVMHLARKSIGQPYKLFVLGEFPHELVDSDPLYCLSASDCVTFVEQTYAMALGKNWSSFFDALQRTRYKNGRIGFETRNHFTEADWNPNNAWLFEDMTAGLVAGASRPMRTPVDRAAFFKKAGIERHDPIQLVETMYVPREKLETALPYLRDADVVEFVKGDGEWKSITHMGLIGHDARGRVTLLHSGTPAVQELPLMEYLARRPAFCGVKVLRPKDSILPSR